MTSEEKTAKTSEHRVASSDAIPTRELLRAQRKSDYERAKAQRKADRKAEKLAAADARTKARAERDAELWHALKRGTDIDATPDSGE